VFIGVAFAPHGLAHFAEYKRKAAGRVSEILRFNIDFSCFSRAARSWRAGGAEYLICEYNDSSDEKTPRFFPSNHACRPKITLFDSNCR